VDFGRLAARRDTELRGRPEGVPRFGRMNRILASRFETKQGVDYTSVCSAGGDRPCPGQLRGRLQPYAIYVPRPRPAGRRYQLTLLLHSLTANYNQFSGTRNQRQFGDRPRPSIVITPENRGSAGFYQGAANADTFEVWADVARRYRLDPRRTTVAGHSMGGFGTFKLAAQHPDLVARAQPTVGALNVPAAMLASVRWVPFLMWNAQRDELVPPRSYLPAADQLRRLGYRYRLNAFEDPVEPPPAAPTPQHLMLALNDQYAPAARFLGTARSVRNPPRVTFVRNPAIDYPSLGTKSRPRVLDLEGEGQTRGSARDHRRSLGGLRSRRRCCAPELRSRRPGGRTARLAPVRHPRHDLGLRSAASRGRRAANQDPQCGVGARRRPACPGHLRGAAGGGFRRAAHGQARRLPGSLGRPSARAGAGVHRTRHAVQGIADHRVGDSEPRAPPV